MEKRFLTNTDETGRFIVHSTRTGRKYFVEPIGPDRAANWGSINPATGEFMNKKGFGKHVGAVDEEESLITKENGFEKIHNLGRGESPMSYITMLDDKYPDKREN